MNTEKSLFLQYCGATCLVGWLAGEKSEQIFNTFANFGLTTKTEPLSTGIYCYITTAPKEIINFLADWQQFHNRRRKKRIPRRDCEKIAKERFEKIPHRNFAAYNSTDGIIDGMAVLSGDFAGIDDSSWQEAAIREG